MRSLLRVLGVLALMLAGAAITPAAATEEATPAGQVVRDVVAAFNAHDVDALLELMHEDVRWMGIDGTELSLQTDGRPALREAMEAYFSGVPSARSILHSVESSGEFVHVLEESVFESQGETRSACSLGVYQIREGRVLHAWYFPAHACD